MIGDSDADAAGPSPSGVKRTRAARIREGQIDALLSFIEARPFLQNRKYSGLGRENFETGWQVVATELNKLPNAAIKSPEQWIVVWRDLKSRAYSKAARLKKERVQKSHRGFSTAPLTEVEQRIISLIAINNTYGTNCPDPMPEEDKQLLQSETESDVAVTDIMILPETKDQNPCSSVAEQHSLAQQNLPAVTESNTVAMKVSAAATKLQAEAARLQARAVKLQAEATKNLAEAAKNQAEAAKNQAEAAKQWAEVSKLYAQAANEIADALTDAINNKIK